MVRSCLSRNGGAALMLLVAIVFGSRSHGQDAAKFSARYIPDDALAAVFASPSRLLTSPALEFFPIEVLQAAALEQIGIDPLHIDHVTLVAGFPTPQGPVGGAVLEFSRDYPFSDLNPKLVGEFRSQEVEGGTLYRADARPGTGPVREVLQPDPRKMVVATAGYAERMLNASDSPPGRLSQLVGKLTRREGLTAVVDFKMVAPFLKGVTQQQMAQLPPQLRDLPELIDLTEALLINVQAEPPLASLTVAALAANDEGAERIETIFNQSLDFAQGLMRRQMGSEFASRDTATDRAMLQYTERISKKLTESMRPSRSGSRVQIDLGGSLGGTGVMVGLLLPAVQGAREAARRMEASNRLKQIGLAMHNYDAAYNKLPDRAIRDSDGKPLLSWRVSLLPYMDQVELHQQFRLDEPWDSPHNMRLISQMPNTYQDASASVPEGHTVFQIPRVEGGMFGDRGEPRFRDVTDGLFQTIMIVEAKRAAAVPWTKPDDVVIDLTAPLANTGDSHAGGFHVLMGDGSVRFIAETIDRELFKGLLTAAGGERVNLDN